MYLYIYAYMYIHVHVYTYMYIVHDIVHHVMNVNVHLLDGNAIKVVNCSSYCAVYLRVHVRKAKPCAGRTTSAHKMRVDAKPARGRLPKRKRMISNQLPGS